jgi:hypothetical protein
MTKVHHATSKKAKALGIKITDNGDGTETYSHAPTGTKIIGGNLKDATAHVQAALKAKAPLAKTGIKPSREKKPRKEDSGASIVKAIYRDRYKKAGATHCGDELAEMLHGALDGKSADNFAAVCKENDLPLKKWEHLNVGQQVMCLSNVLRARLRKGEKVSVLGRPVRVAKAA